MIKHIIFDLSDVFIGGLKGVNRKVGAVLNIPEDSIGDYFGGELLENICIGNLTEEEYLQAIIHREQWTIDLSQLKSIIRQNFHIKIPGTIPLLDRIHPEYTLILHSDHGREWIAYIHQIHPFLQQFDHQLYSYTLKSIKRNPQSFQQLLKLLAIQADECVFIDDSYHNVQTAMTLGIDSIRFTDADHLEMELDNRKLIH